MIELGGPRHEHLYEVIGHNMIESGNFKKTDLENERMVSGSRVMLCTISMLSSRKVMQSFTKIVPVQTVIIDEASQIEVGDYLPALAKYKTSLRKMVFIGDDKQCRCRGGGAWNRDILTVDSQWLPTDKTTSRN